MKQAVSAVIPTLGRPTLNRAVQSVLGQTRPVTEVIVVADNDDPLALPDDPRITLMHTPFRSGASRCRQLAIDAARGDVIALLDDDDEWYDTKLERQLATVAVEGGPHWIASSRFAVLGPGDRRRIWPRRLIEPQQSVPEYLFRFSDLRMGGADLQSSTLCFPTELARKVPWDTDIGVMPDEATWIMGVRQAFPDVRVIQLADVLSTYDVSQASESRSPSDISESYTEWGLRYLGTESPRVLGDYLCTYPVSAAVLAHSLRGVRAAVRSAFRHGRPGPFAVCYAVLNGARIAIRSTGSVAPG